MPFTINQWPIVPPDAAFRQNVAVFDVLTGFEVVEEAENTDVRTEFDVFWRGMPDGRCVDRSVPLIQMPLSFRKGYRGPRMRYEHHRM
jgi:hypothetical protein